MISRDQRAEWEADDLLHARGPKMSEGSEPLPMRGKLVLRGAVRLIVPFVFLFGLYVELHGDYGPGGGFQAGVIFAAGFILFGLIFGSELSEVVFPARWAERLMAFGLLLFAGVGVFSLFAPGDVGYNFLDYDALGGNGQHYGIVAIEVGVGLTVAAAMVRLFYAFANLSELSEALEESLDKDTPLQDAASAVPESAGESR